MKTIGYVSCSPCYGLQYMLLREGGVKLRVLIDDYLEIPNYPNFEDASGLKAAFGKHIEFVKPEGLKGCDFIFVDYNDVKRELMDELRALGVPFIGGDDFTDLLEEDREFGKRIASYCGLHVNEGRFFATQTHAVRYLKSLDKGTAVYLKGAANSVQCRDTEEAIDLVSSQGLAFFEPAPWMQKTDEYKPGVYIDTKVEGHEVAYGAFWLGGQWAHEVIFTREFKHAMQRGQGSILTGEIGTAFRITSFDAMPIAFRDAFLLLSDTLKKTDFRGFIDINAIVNEQGTWFLEWTTRPGYPTELEIAGACSAISGGRFSYAEFLHGIAVGDKARARLPKCSGLAAALYAHGLGLANFDACAMGITPKVYGTDKVGEHSAVRLLPFDVSLEINSKRQPEWRIASWDRGLFVAKYSPEYRSNDMDFWRRLNEDLYLAVKNLHCWGHSFRLDLFGTNRLPTSFLHVKGVLDAQGRGALLEEPKRPPSVNVVHREAFGQSLIAQCYGLELRAYRGNDSWEYGNFADEFRKPNTHMMGVFDSRKVLLGAALYLVTDGGNAHITYVATDPVIRGEGYGRKLLARVESEVRQRGGTQVLLDAAPDVVKWYEEQGYESIDLRADRTYLMKKAI